MTLLALCLGVLALSSCSARWTRLDSPPGVAAYKVEIRWGTEALP